MGFEIDTTHTSVMVRPNSFSGRTIFYIKILLQSK